MAVSAHSGLGMLSDTAVLRETSCGRGASFFVTCGMIAATNHANDVQYRRKLTLSIIPSRIRMTPPSSCVSPRRGLPAFLPNGRRRECWEHRARGGAHTVAPLARLTPLPRSVMPMVSR